MFMALGLEIAAGNAHPSQDEQHLGLLACPSGIRSEEAGPFEIDDEWYYHMRFREGMEGVTPILTAIPPESTLSRPDGPHSGNPHVRKEAGQPQHWAGFAALLRQLRFENHEPRLAGLVLRALDRPRP